MSPDLRGLNETTWEHITWHTVDLEKKNVFYYYISPDPLRNRCQDGIQCVRNLLEETSVKENGERGRRGRESLQAMILVTPSEREREGKED